MNMVSPTCLLISGEVPVVYFWLWAARTMITAMAKNLSWVKSVIRTHFISCNSLESLGGKSRLLVRHRQYSKSRELSGCCPFFSLTCQHSSQRCNFWMPMIESIVFHQRHWQQTKHSISGFSSCAFIFCSFLVSCPHFLMVVSTETAQASLGILFYNLQRSAQYYMGCSMNEKAINIKGPKENYFLIPDIIKYDYHGSRSINSTKGIVWNKNQLYFLEILNL
jgi:hypothetical protein